jgi:tetratricopeptide (TPR) repeat protein
LLDAWPLRRNPSTLRATVEKLPLFALAAASCAITLAVQRGAMGSAAAFPFPVRLANALLAWVTYLRRAIAPYDLAIHHAYPSSVSIPRLLAAALLLSAVTVAALHARRRAPWLAVGWLWFLGTLVPMVGLVQVGSQAMADRYAYLPFLGLYWIAAWAAGALAARRPRLRVVVIGAALAALLGLAIATRGQLEVWRDPRSLFEQALANGGPSAMAHFNLGIVHHERHDLGRARRHYEEALRLQPDHAAAHNNLGTILEAQGRFGDALAAYRAALAVDPHHPEAQANVERVLAAIAGRETR